MITDRRTPSPTQCMSGCWASPALLSGLRPPALSSSTYAAAPLAAALAFRSIPSSSRSSTSSWPFLTSSRRFKRCDSLSCYGEGVRYCPLTN